MAGGRRELVDGDEFPEKPKRMRWTTYRRLEERYYRYMEGWAAAAMKRFGMKL